MKQLDRGILLSRRPYSETSLIVTLFTEKEGLNTFLFQGAKKKKGIVLFPLAPVEFAFYRRADSTLGKLTEMNLLDQLHDLPSNPIKSSLAFFMVEILQKSIHEGHADQALFDFLHTEIVWLNHTSEYSNYALWFLAQYSRFCGIAPSIETDEFTLFDLRNGRLTDIRPMHPQYIEAAPIHWMKDMLDGEKMHFLSAIIPKSERSFLLETWLTYYRSHMSGLHELKSLDIIREVLN